MGYSGAGAEDGLGTGFGTGVQLGKFEAARPDRCQNSPRDIFGTHSLYPLVKRNLTLPILAATIDQGTVGRYRCRQGETYRAECQGARRKKGRKKVHVRISSRSWIVPRKR